VRIQPSVVRQKRESGANDAPTGWPLTRVYRSLRNATATWRASTDVGGVTPSPRAETSAAAPRSEAATAVVASCAPGDVLADQTVGCPREMIAPEELPHRVEVDHTPKTSCNSIGTGASSCS